MSAPVDILVTGFGPFPHVRINPTAVLARLVARHLRRSGWSAQALVLETSYAGGLPALGTALAQMRPKAVLMLGVAARSRSIRVELFGRGHASPLHPDASGGTPGRATRAASLPLRTRAGPEAALSRLRQAGVHAQLSASAGRYLCDASYALALRTMAPTTSPVLFIHVPWLRPRPGQRRVERVADFRPDRNALAQALAQIGAGLARQGRPGRAAMAQERRHDP